GLAADRLWRGCNRSDNQIGRRRQQHGQRAGLVVIVVELVGIIWIDVGVEGCLLDLAEGIGEWREVKLPGNVLRQNKGDGLVIVVSNGERAAVRGSCQKHVAFARVGPGTVAAEPDR